MKRLLILILTASALWFAFWAVGAYRMTQAIADWADTRRAEGWLVEFSNSGVQGFPNRFDARWTDLQLADPDTGLAWDMPEFMLASLSYQPGHRIAVWPDEIGIATPTQKYVLKSQDLRASLRMDRDQAYRVERAYLTGQNLALTGDDTTSLTALNLAFERQGDQTYRLGIKAQDLSPPATWLQRLAGPETLPRVVQSVTMDARVQFDKDWDQAALDTARPQPRQIALNDARAKWGVMALRATGTLDIDDAGRASDSLTVKADYWREMLDIAERAGRLPPDVRGAAEQALNLIAGLKGNPNSIDAELTLRDGKMSLGFLPLGEFPRLTLR